MSPASQSFRFRESRRVLREAPVRLSMSGEQADIAARTRDIAVGGMFVATEDLRPVGAGARFVLDLGAGDATDTVQGEATVVWVREESGDADQPAGMGMKFSRVEPPGEERLALLFSEQPDEAPAAADGAQPPPAEVEESRVAVPEALDETPVEASVEADEPVTSAAEDEVEPAEEREATGDAGAEALPAVADELAPDEDAAAEAESLEDAAFRGAEPSETESSQPVTTPDEATGETRAELFGDLATDDDDWMKPESDRPSWVWPTVAGVILVGLLLVFLRGPLMRLVGMGGGGGEEQPQPVAQSIRAPGPGRGCAAPDLRACGGSRAGPGRRRGSRPVGASPVRRTGSPFVRAGNPGARADKPVRAGGCPVFPAGGDVFGSGNPIFPGGRGVNPAGRNVFGGGPTRPAFRDGGPVLRTGSPTPPDAESAAGQRQRAAFHHRLGAGRSDGGRDHGQRPVRASRRHGA